LIQHARTHWRTRSKDQPVQVLSAPCANGEEPYSIAMALADAGVPAAAQRIIALDLSQRALAHARTATYTAKAIREIPPALAERYLEGAGDRWRVRSDIRAAVDFRRANLLDVASVVGGMSFDAVFCRNGLIYLAADARDRILAQLRAVLAPDGLVFLGHAESGLAHAAGLAPAGPAGAFVFRRMVSGTDGSQPIRRPALRTTITPAPVSNGVALSRGMDPAADRHTRSPEPKRGIHQPAPKTDPTIGPYDSARTDWSTQVLSLQHLSTQVDEGASTRVSLGQLADAGRYAEALAGAQVWLARHPADAEMHHLCGLILTAMNQTEEARRCYERALYLDPAHMPSLALLQGLLEARGDTAGAERLQARMQRVEARS
jgi:chemotaxis protein methyltransferase WspC